jgi:hypothetical protein
VRRAIQSALLPAFKDGRLTIPPVVDRPGGTGGTGGASVS